MVNRRPSPAIVVPEGVVKGEGRKGDLLIWDEKLYPFWGHSFLFFFVFSSYLANDNSSHVKSEVERCLIMDNIKFNRK